MQKGETVKHFSLNTWKMRDITQDTKDAIKRDEEEAKAEDARKASHQ